MDVMQLSAVLSARDEFSRDVDRFERRLLDSSKKNYGAAKLDANTSSAEQKIAALQGMVTRLQKSPRPVQIGADTASASKEIAALQQQVTRLSTRATIRVDVERAKDRVGDQLSRASTIAGVSIAGTLALATRQAVDFEAAMRNVNSIAQLSEREFERLNDAVVKIAQDPCPPRWVCRSSTSSFRAAPGATGRPGSGVARIHAAANPNTLWRPHEATAHHPRKGTTRRRCDPEKGGTAGRYLPCLPAAHRTARLRQLRPSPAASSLAHRHDTEKRGAARL